tara:strand:- start:8817 stop:9167 length:351 start_codon:yes stop_codon:yes gene_type:complete
MKIEIGKTYIAKNGEKLKARGPLKDCLSHIKMLTRDGEVIELTSEGKYWPDGAESDWDIVGVHTGKKKRIRELEEKVEKLTESIRFIEDRLRGYSIDENGDMIVTKNYTGPSYTEA